MEESILAFPDQFSYEPEIINGEALPKFRHCIVNGMGGSHLHAGLLKAYDPSIDMTVHSNYGLPREAHHPPANASASDDTLFIANSHSGNTEEVLDFAHQAHENGYHIACIATGGKLIEYAQENNLPYIQMPDTGIQPLSYLLTCWSSPCCSELVAHPATPANATMSASQTELRCLRFVTIDPCVT